MSQFAQNSFGATFGGPLKIPGVYADANRRTNFQVNYSGTASNNVFDQYATVPTAAMRSGDFSATPFQLVDPTTGQPFAGNPTTILRGGYSITYNSGSYASIARQLSGEPPFADTETVSGTGDAPLTLAEALLAPAAATTNNWGVDRDYALGMIQTWNVTLIKNLTQDWMVQAGYTGIKGSDLDILRAPALGANGVLIPGSQPFIWESSGGRSLMNAANVQVRRRLAGGFSGGVSYTFAHAMDDASSLGAGALTS